jgi:hypothetical protein
MKTASVVTNSHENAASIRVWHLLRTRGVQWIAGITTFKLIDGGFDYLLYPFVIYSFGALKGGLVMMALSILICLTYIWIYDRLKRDWLGIEWVKELRSYEGKSRVGLCLRWLLRRSEVLAFVALSIRFDPFITTTYLRRSSYDGLTRRDWTIFFGSAVVSNGAWTLVCFGGVEGFRRFL